MKILLKSKFLIPSCHAKFFAVFLIVQFKQTFKATICHLKIYQLPYINRKYKWNYIF